MDPTLYHFHHSLYAEDLPFWLGLAARSHGPLLELGCGTGRVTHPLAGAGHMVYGIDHNFEMLTYCKEHIEPKQQSRVRLVQGDMTGFHLGSQFGLIFAPCNTISTLPEEALRETISLAYTHLKPGGIFLHPV